MTCKVQQCVYCYNQVMKGKHGLLQLPLIVYNLHEIRHFGVTITKVAIRGRKTESCKRSLFLNWPLSRQARKTNSMFPVCEMWCWTEARSPLEDAKYTFFCTWLRQNCFLFIYLSRYSKYGQYQCHWLLTVKIFAYSKMLRSWPRKSVLKSEMIWNVTEIYNFSFSIVYILITWKR